MGSKNKNRNDFVMKGDWNKQALVLQNQFSQLRHEDLQFETGKEEDLLRRLGNLLNKNRHEVITLIQKGQPEKDDDKQDKKQGPDYGRNL